MIAVELAIAAFVSGIFIGVALGAVYAASRDTAVIMALSRDPRDRTVEDAARMTRT